jgi:hypothetical protein
VHGHRENTHHKNPFLHDIMVGEEDLTQLVTKCVEAPETLKFAIFHGISDNRFKRLDISHTRETLGYAPTDDAGDGLSDFNIPEPQPIHDK